MCSSHVRPWVLFSQTTRAPPPCTLLGPAPWQRTQPLGGDEGAGGWPGLPLMLWRGHGSSATAAAEGGDTGFLLSREGAGLIFYCYGRGVNPWPRQGPQVACSLCPGHGSLRPWLGHHPVSMGFLPRGPLRLGLPVLETSGLLLLRGGDCLAPRWAPGGSPLGTGTWLGL